VKIGIFLAFALFAAVFFSLNSVAQLDCTYKNAACGAGETKVLGLHDITNAHAELSASLITTGMSAARCRALQ
jgi:hypothetical protein